MMFCALVLSTLLLNSSTTIEFRGTYSCAECAPIAETLQTSLTRRMHNDGWRSFTVLATCVPRAQR